MLQGKFDLVISTEILLKSEEIIQKKYGQATSNALVSLMKELPNVHNFIFFYRWKLMVAGPDDDKYIDCAIAGHADYIVSEDKHFSILKKIPFPKLTEIKINDFIKLIISL